MPAGIATNAAASPNRGSTSAPKFNNTGMGNNKSSMTARIVKKVRTAGTFWEGGVGFFKVLSGPAGRLSGLSAYRSAPPSRVLNGR
jgi:hypothetical protein